LHVNYRNSSIPAFLIDNSAGNIYIDIKKVNARITSEALPRRWMSVTFPLREVSSGLISTTAAPDSFAIRGMSQAGETCAGVPKT